jgi:hypothetical protein
LLNKINVHWGLGIRTSTITETPLQDSLNEQILFVKYHSLGTTYSTCKVTEAPLYGYRGLPLYVWPWYRDYRYRDPSGSAHSNKVLRRVGGKRGRGIRQKCNLNLFAFLEHRISKCSLIDFKDILITSIHNLLFFQKSTKLIFWTQ